MTDERHEPEFGSTEGEIRGLCSLYTQALDAEPPGSDPLRVAASVLARRRHGAWQLSDGAVLTLVTHGLLALARDAGTNPDLLVTYSGAARTVQRFAALLDGAGGPAAVEDVVLLAEEAMGREAPDPESYEALAALGLYRLWRDERG